MIKKLVISALFLGSGHATAHTLTSHYTSQAVGVFVNQLGIESVQRTSLKGADIHVAEQGGVQGAQLKITESLMGLLAVVSLDSRGVPVLSVNEALNQIETTYGQRRLDYQFGLNSELRGDGL